VNLTSGIRGGGGPDDVRLVAEISSLAIIISTHTNGQPRAEVFRLKV